MDVLIIEDDYSIIKAISVAFRIGWPDTNISYTRQGEEGINLVVEEKPDVIILDLGLPDVSGFEVLKRIRLFSGVPIIVLTVRSDEQGIVKALDLRADDYIIKPFRQLELLARIKAATRKRLLNKELPLDLGGMIFYVAGSKLKYGGSVVHLTNTESQILYHLAFNAGKTITFNSLSQLIWDSYYPGAVGAIRSHIKNLRRKMEVKLNHSRMIMTKPGEGYLFLKHKE